MLRKAGLPSVSGGVALVEFQIVLLLGLLPLVLGLLQFALLQAGAAQLDYVAFEAARAGAAAAGDSDRMQRAVTRALVPQLAPSDVPLASDSAGAVVARAWLAAQAEAAAFITLASDRPEAGLLRVRVTYCHPLHVPLVPDLFLPVLRRADPSLVHQRCYAARRVPVASEAVLPMSEAPGASGSSRP